MVDDEYDNEYPENGCLLFIFIVVIASIVLYHFI